MSTQSKQQSKQSFIVYKTFVTSLMLIAAMQEYAAAKQCRSIFTPSRASQIKLNEEKTTEIKSILEARALENTSLTIKSRSGVAYQVLKSFEINVPAIKLIDGGIFYSKMLRLLNNEELSGFHDTLSRVLENAKEKLDQSATESEIKATLSRELFEVLKNKMTIKTAQERAEMLFVENKKIEIALGMMSFRQLKEEMVGDIHNISPDSLVGRYLKEVSDLKGYEVKAEVRRFFVAPNSSELGPERLYIPMDISTFSIYSKYFGVRTDTIQHWHTNHQGTLYLTHNGELLSYAGSSSSGQVRPTGNNLIVPNILLSSTEGSRTLNYFSLGKLEEGRAKTPWNLVYKKEDNSKENYCGRGGGYTSCTHWVGEMAIGDKKVQEYRFPGVVDSHAYNNIQGLSAAENAKPRTYKVGKYNRYNDYQPIGSTAYRDRLTRLVWKEDKGSMQFWEMLDLKDQLDSGELANPGYVLYSLIGNANADRVPLVFINVSNISTGMPTNEQLKQQIYAY